ncbi:NUDIX hydrolase [Rhodovulum euryhalinum]|uniref:8-oxo-dGTP pyrophosphatase MutT (NUDIX family) n=1 Tax=Rhodovulum euryhalinum TaxID=35805 RepID=A0A4R2KSB9_9RHOB|nr:NUDIX hydrolase [Rhodovulum euryhalinum]TCO73899.1 8-oxo-dGTP pyrophosphatase MutT (NUDIX family) [Rhodovulum euryhalinum]
MLKRVWNTLILPLLGRPARFQVAALCYRGPREAPEILLISSRDTHRWILPKGWPKAGFGASDMAAQEAWEEAGVRPRHVRPDAIGRYRYTKRLKGGVPVATDVNVFAIEVETLEDGFPEAAERTRCWMRPDQAADAVDEPELKALLRNLPAVLSA